MTYGCFNRPPMKTEMLVKDGYFQSKANVFDIQHSHSMRTIKIQNSTHCQYSRDTPSDPQCEGCQNQAQDQLEPQC